jgi:hypothetical protein
VKNKKQVKIKTSDYPQFIKQGRFPSHCIMSNPYCECAKGQFCEALSNVEFEPVNALKKLRQPLESAAAVDTIPPPAKSAEVSL